MELICKICGEKFFHEKENYCIRAMCGHLKNVHNISKEDYLVQFYRNGVHPTCACGCGNPVKVAKGWNKFQEFYADSHVILNEKQKQKQKEAITKLVNSKEYILEKYNESSLKEALIDFKSHKKTLQTLSDELNIDKRTLKSVWTKLRWATLEEIESICLYNQIQRSSETRTEAIEKTIYGYKELYELAKKWPKKFSIHGLIQEYNNLHPGNEIISCSRTVLKTLQKIYGEEIIELLLYGYHSKIEMQFFDILKFYFGKSKVKSGFVLQWGINKKQQYIYDICIDDKVIIEYDGDYFHENSKEFDEQKSNFAISKGYKIIRISSSNANNIEILYKIKTLLND